MSKALYAGGSHTSVQLLHELQTLRRRVQELEAALAQAEQAASREQAPEVVDLRPQAAASS